MDPFVGQLLLVPYNFEPDGWMLCDGRTVQIAEYGALFGVIGTKYGGDGRITFALPDLRGRFPIGMGVTPGTGTRYTLGEKGGTEQVTLTAPTMLPAHTHRFFGSGQPGNSQHAAGALPASGQTLYRVAPLNASFANRMCGSYPENTQNLQPHENRPPFLVLKWIIAYAGIYPVRD